MFWGQPQVAIEGTAVSGTSALASFFNKFVHSGLL